MQIRLHANATTTPKQRAYIQASTRPVAKLAEELGVSETTIRRWRVRGTVQDRPHTPHRLATTLNPMQEFVVVELRKLLLLPLDDLLVVARAFVCPDLSRSALDRCLRRHGVAARLADLLPEVEGKPPLPKTFKNDEPGLVQVDIKYLPRMPDETEHRYLIVAIDRASRWVYYEIQPDKTGDTAAGFLERLRAKAPFRLRTVLTEYGKAFTDRFGATGAREPTGQHRFDHVCAAHGIDHRLIKPRHPQTNGMIERFNGRIAEVLKTTTFASARQLETTLQRYLHLYNHYIPQKNLGHVAPITKLKDYYRTKPALFQKRPINLPGPDSSSICLGSNAPMTSRRQV
ncbi:MAG TPA: IS481 family transposase [Xanthomonadaceae bacterium]|nr:IS481 family transposase [Xanthomonadaceae bacterium]